MKKINRSNRTYRRALTKKRKAMRIELTILIALVIGTGVIGASGEMTKRALADVYASTAQITYSAPKATTTPAVEPKKATREVVSQTIREVTAYNAGDPSQTDASPCISANGEDICKALALGFNRCAANFVKLGTDLEITAANGWTMICKVTDRMNSRFTDRVDIAMTFAEKERAVKFGLQNLTVKILK